MKKYVRLSWVYVCLAGCLLSNFVQAEDAVIAKLERQLEQIAEWYPGTYDNYNQVNFENNGYAGPQPKYPHGRIPQIITHLPEGPLGKYVFYQQQYANGEYDKVYRQRIMIFSIDAEKKHIMQKSFALKDAEKYVDAHLQPEKFAALTMEGLVRFFPESCAMIWRKVGDQFQGDIPAGKCLIDSRRHPGEKRIITASNILTEKALFSMEGGTKEDGMFVFGQKDGDYYHSLKARPFTCWIDLRQENGSYQNISGLKTHDQGKKVYFGEAEPGQKRSYLRLKQTIFPTGDRPPVFEIFIHKDGAEKATGYSWTSPEARMIGINLRWMLASCKLDGYGGILIDQQ